VDGVVDDKVMWQAGDDGSQGYKRHGRCIKGSKSGYVWMAAVVVSYHEGGRRPTQGWRICWRGIAENFLAAGGPIGCELSWAL
jgi:hypothetical protein